MPMDVGELCAKLSVCAPPQTRFVSGAPTVMDCGYLATVKDCVTGDAARKAALPAWSAVTVQVPPVRMFTEVLDALEQTDGVFDVNVTASPDDAVAEKLAVLSVL